MFKYLNLMFMKTCKSFYSKLLVIVFVTAVVLNGCKKDNSSSDPSVPPSSSMVMDFSAFKSTKSANVVVTNWAYSAVVVTYWSAILNGACAIPVAAFQKAIGEKAAYISNNTWQWAFSVPTDSLTINAKLQGTLMTDSVQWKMYITLTKGSVTYPEFLWFEGKSAFNQTGGWWLLYESPAKPNALLKINWSKTSDKVGSLKYTYVKPGDAGAGGYIEFGTVDDPIYDAYYTIFGKVDNINVAIKWNRTSKEGRVKSPFFSDTAWHCWSATLENVNCSN